MSETNEKSERHDRNVNWSEGEDKALEELARAAESWSAEQISSLLARRGFPQRTRSAVLGRLHRNGVKLRGLAAHTGSERKSKRATHAVRQGFLRNLGVTVKERAKRHSYSIKGRTEADTLIPDTSILRRHAKPDEDALALPVQALTEKTCRFPFGLAAPYLFCGLPTVGKSRYCAKHFDLTHN